MSLSILGVVGGWVGGSMSVREQVHKTYHSADGCGASVGVLPFTSLFSHYKRETNAGVGILFLFCQKFLWVFFMPPTNLPHSKSLHVF